MDITLLAQIISRLQQNLDETLSDISALKSEYIKAGAFELASKAREWEKKLIEMKEMAGN